MAKLILFNKPFQVLSQFTDNQDRKTLNDFIDIKSVYPAGRLDYDSEGLLVLTDSGAIQHQISHPKHKLPKTYWVQVEGSIEQGALERLRQGVELKDGITKPAKVKCLDKAPDVWARTPPIRFRQAIPTQWIEISITEGKNRQVRRMTAAVGLPTLRLIRVAIGNWQLGNIQPGHYAMQTIHPPQTSKNRGKR